jgi:Aldehyde dehydrogenase family
MTAGARVAGVTVSLDHYIGGQRSPSSSGARFADLSPIDQRVLGEVARGGPDAARAAVDAASAAFQSWGATPPARRPLLPAHADRPAPRPGPRSSPRRCSGRC